MYEKFQVFFIISSLFYIKLEPSPVYKEADCEDIIAKYAVKGKKGLLSSSPLQDIIAYLDKTGTIFRDAQFSPDQSSLNDQPEEKTGLVLYSSN